jgi:hypothetical protein
MILYTQFTEFNNSFLYVLYFPFAQIPTTLNLSDINLKVLHYCYMC